MSSHLIEISYLYCTKKKKDKGAAMENKISENMRRNLIYCHLSIVTFCLRFLRKFALKMGFTRAHQIF
jgi:hypothetical protein